VRGENGRSPEKIVSFSAGVPPYPVGRKINRDHRLVFFSNTYVSGTVILMIDAS